MGRLTSNMREHYRPSKYTAAIPVFHYLFFTAFLLTASWSVQVDGLEDVNMVVPETFFSENRPAIDEAGLTNIRSFLSPDIDEAVIETSVDGAPTGVSFSEVDQSASSSEAEKTGYLQSSEHVYSALLSGESTGCT